MSHFAQLLSSVEWFFLVFFLFLVYCCLLTFFTTFFFQCFILDGQGLCLELAQRTNVDRLLNPNIYCCCRFRLSHFLFRCKFFQTSFFLLCILFLTCHDNYHYIINDTYVFSTIVITEQHFFLLPTLHCLRSNVYSWYFIFFMFLCILPESERKTRPSSKWRTVIYSYIVFLSD